MITPTGRWRSAAILLIASAAVRAHRRARQQAYVRGLLTGLTHRSDIV